ncbi:MAG: hypothetical protein IID18_09045 [Nitrospinae bacterium]|nr:hypothetical protein [Nitrospinota bacterium]
MLFMVSSGDDFCSYRDRESGRFPEEAPDGLISKNNQEAMAFPTRQGLAMVPKKTLDGGRCYSLIFIQQFLLWITENDIPGSVLAVDFALKKVALKVP